MSILVNIICIGLSALQQVMVQNKELKVLETEAGLGVKGKIQAQELVSPGKLPKSLSSGQSLESGAKGSSLRSLRRITQGRV